MKLSTAFIIIVALQLSLILFSEGTYSYSNSNLLLAILNPSDMGSTAILSVLATAVLLVVVTGVFLGSVLGFKTDTMLFAGLVLLLAGWLYPITALNNMIVKEQFFGNSSAINVTANCPNIQIQVDSNGSYIYNQPDPNCLEGLSGIDANKMFAAIITAPFYILMLWSVWGWWRNSQGD